MNIGILGFGSVGQKLAHLFSTAGHSVMIGTHHATPPAGIPYPTGSFKETAKASDALALAIPFSACIEVLPELAPLLAGKIVIDNTNPLKADWSPLLLGQENSAAETISGLVPQARVVKAFNTIFADIMQPDRLNRSGMRVTAFVCGDDLEAKRQIMDLAQACGLAPIDAGPLRVARHLESMAHLNIQIAVGQGGGTNAAFLYHQATSASQPAESPNAQTPLVVTEWVSEKDPLFVRSAIIEGQTEIGLVDTQFTNSNALRFAADILERGKPVKWVYITHPHLDHFNGAALLRHVFPQARFYVQPSGLKELDYMVATRQASLGASVPGGPSNLPSVAPDFIQPLDGNSLTLDGERVEILAGPGDHPDSSVVWVPAARTVITGDVVFSKTHAFTGDHRNIQGWIDLVKRIQALNPKTVIVGHGDPAARHGAEVLAEQIQWLEDFQAAIQEHDSLDHVSAVMLRKYPQYANDFIFAFSYNVMRPAE